MNTSFVRSLHLALVVVILVVTLLSWWGKVLYTTADHSEPHEALLFGLLFSMTVFSLLPAFALLGTTLYAAVVRRKVGEAVAGIGALALMYIMARTGMNMMEFYD